MNDVGQFARSLAGSAGENFNWTTRCEGKQKCVNDLFPWKLRMDYCKTQSKKINFTDDKYEKKRKEAPPIMQSMMLSPAERFCLTRLRILILTSGVTSGLGQGVIGSGLGLLLQSLYLPVNAISLLPILNKDAGIWSPYERGDFFMTEGGAGAGEEIGDYERLLSVEMHSESSITLGRIIKESHVLEREGKYFFDSGETRSINLQDLEKVMADVILRAMMKKTYEKVHGNGIKSEHMKLSFVPAVMILDVGGVTGDKNNGKLLGAISRLKLALEGELAVNLTGATLKDPEFPIPIEDRILHIHTAAMPEVKQDSRDMIYPIVQSINELANRDLKPDLLIVRSGKPAPDVRTVTGGALARRLASEVSIDPKSVFFIDSVGSDYAVPVYLKEHNILHQVVKKFDLTYAKSNETIKEIQNKELFSKIYSLHERLNNTSGNVTIGLIGKYTLEPKSYVTVTKSIEYAAAMLNVTANIVLIEATYLEETMLNASDPQFDYNNKTYHEHWQRLYSVKGAVVAGGAAGRGTDGMVAAMKHTREKDVPTLGICLGMQHMVIEFARNVLNIPQANTEETNETISEDFKVIHRILYQRDNNSLPGPRLGGHLTYLSPDSIISSLYQNDKVIQQRYAQNFGMNKKFRQRFEASDMVVTGYDQKTKNDSERSDVVEYRKNRFHVGVQYHPEFLSDPIRPVRPFLALVAAAMNGTHLKDLRANGGNVTFSADVSNFNALIHNMELEIDDFADNLYLDN